MEMPALGRLGTGVASFFASSLASSSFASSPPVALLSSTACNEKHLRPRAMRCATSPVDCSGSMIVVQP
jgi:hypothetical protein